MPKFIILHVLSSCPRTPWFFGLAFSGEAAGEVGCGRGSGVCRRVHGAACRIVVPGPELHLFSRSGVQSLSAGPPTKSQTWNYLLKRLVFLQLNGLGTLVENQLLIDIRFISELSILPPFVYICILMPLFLLLSLVVTFKIEKHDPFIWSELPPPIHMLKS